jgi:hypothetical protein
MTDTSSEPTSLGADERAELDRLRREVTELRAGSPAAAPRGATGRGGGWWRTLLAVILITLACLLAPLSAVSVWARGEVTDTDRYVETVAPLADDPAFQQAIAARITRTVFNHIDVEDITERALNALANSPELPKEVAAALPALSVPLTNGLRSFTEDQVLAVVRSDTFDDAWVAAQRTAHEQLVAALSGEDSAVSVNQQSVSVNLAAIIEVVKQRLIDRGFQLAERIPETDVEFVVFESADVGKVQTAYSVLDTVGYWMPFIVVAIALLGVYVARNHRRALIGLGLGLAASLFLAAVGLQVLRTIYIDALPSTVDSTAAATALYDTVIRFLVDAVRAGVLLGLIIAAAAFLTGPSVTANRVRRGGSAVTGWVHRGVEATGVSLERIGAWVRPRAGLLSYSLVVAAVLVLLFQTYRDVQLVVWLTVAVLVGVFIIQVLASTRTEPGPEAPA